MCIHNYVYDKNNDIKFINFILLHTNKNFNYLPCITELDTKFNIKLYGGISESVHETYKKRYLDLCDYLTSQNIQLNEQFMNLYNKLRPEKSQ